MATHLASGGTGRVSQLADRIETAQLQMADRLHTHALDVLAGPGWDKRVATEPESLAVDLTDALREVLLIAESRGLRLGLPGLPGHAAEG
ncbi:hypothetical protein AB0P17_33685 [Streptomyces sp. NPDC088124]|uniref:hypothetical protein n=1 Tax=Streptomyces sp. NPDC088124 TaxID=3154654 RepID=UPI0034496515